MPSPLPRQVPWSLFRSCLSIASSLPCVTVRSAPAIVFSGPAQRSLTLWPARSPSRHATLYIESSDSFVASAAASIATGWSEPVPGRELHPLKSSAFHGALLRQQSDWKPGDGRNTVLRRPREQPGMGNRARLTRREATGCTMLTAWESKKEMPNNSLGIGLGCAIGTDMPVLDLLGCRI